MDDQSRRYMGQGECSHGDRQDAKSDVEMVRTCE